jgi:hypothetical protein
MVRFLVNHSFFMSPAEGADIHNMRYRDLTISHDVVPRRRPDHLPQ